VFLALFLNPALHPYDPALSVFDCHQQAFRTGYCGHAVRTQIQTWDSHQYVIAETTLQVVGDLCPSVMERSIPSQLIACYALFR
jgi:hypothetical protein